MLLSSSPGSGSRTTGVRMRQCWRGSRPGGQLASAQRPQGAGEEASQRRQAVIGVPTAGVPAKSGPPRADDPPPSVRTGATHGAGETHDAAQKAHAAGVGRGKDGKRVSAAPCFLWATLDKRLEASGTLPPIRKTLVLMSMLQRSVV